MLYDPLRGFLKFCGAGLSRLEEEGLLKLRGGTSYDFCLTLVWETGLYLVWETGLWYYGCIMTALVTIGWIYYGIGYW